MNSNHCGRILEHKQQRKGKRASVASFSVTKIFFLSYYLLHFSVQICPFSLREIIVNRPLLRSPRSRDFYQAAFVGLVWPSDERKWLGQPRLHIRPLTQWNTYGVLGGCEGFCSAYWRFLYHPTSLLDGLGRANKIVGYAVTRFLGQSELNNWVKMNYEFKASDTKTTRV